MSPDVSKDDDPGEDVFRPPVDDYFRRFVCDDHKANQVLHAALREADDVALARARSKR